MGGRFVMPGLIDAHFHAYGSEMNPALIASRPSSEPCMPNGFWRQRCGGGLPRCAMRRAEM